jgi:hypothetical protein
MSKTGKAVLIVSVILGIIYFALMSAAANGYGYMGYYGYHRGPSFWYWGGPSTYYDRDVRSGSVSGSSVRGGGPGSGK